MVPHACRVNSPLSTPSHGNRSCFTTFVLLSLRPKSGTIRNCGEKLIRKTTKMDNYLGAVYDFGMIVDRAEVPSAADYVRRACAYCCGQVRPRTQRVLHAMDRTCYSRSRAMRCLTIVLCLRDLFGIASYRALQSHSAFPQKAYAVLAFYYGDIIS